MECNEAVRREKDKTGLIGLELEGKKFGVIGLGAIGTRTAKLAQAFGCEVYGFNRSERRIDGVKMTDMDTLLSECDIVSLHVPLTEETRGMIGSRELSRMKQSAILINTARGPVVDSQALAEALRGQDCGSRGGCIRNRASGVSIPSVVYLSESDRNASCGVCHKGGAL